MTSNFDAFVLVGKREFAKFERFEILYMDWADSLPPRLCER
jgi:hypothetical protein